MQDFLSEKRRQRSSRKAASWARRKAGCRRNIYFFTQITVNWPQITKNRQENRRKQELLSLLYIMSGYRQENRRKQELTAPSHSPPQGERQATRGTSRRLGDVRNTLCVPARRDGAHCVIDQASNAHVARCAAVLHSVSNKENQDWTKSTKILLVVLVIILLFWFDI